METSRFQSSSTQEKHCLNRTMQYGNFDSDIVRKILMGSLNRTMQYGNHKERQEEWVSFEFKSYYVVWKHEQVNCFELPRYCLNRTMQYGNEITKHPNFNDERGLNRTMQYGNLSVVCIIIIKYFV